MLAKLPPGWNRRYWFAFVGVLAAWLFSVWTLGPWIVREAYAQRSFGFLNRMISGRDVHPVEFYLTDLSRLGWQVAIAIGLAGAVVYSGVLWRRSLLQGVQRFGVWFRVSALVPSAHVVGWGVAWGLGLGLAEVAVVTIRQRLFGLPIRDAVSSQMPASEMIWMAPAAGAVAFAVIAVGLLMCSRWLPRLRSIRAVNLLFGALSAYALVGLASRTVHPAAAALLSLGVGVQIARASGRLSAPLVARAWVLAVGLMVVVGGVSALQYGRLVLAKRSSLAASVLAADAPNVLLVVLDTVRAQNLSLYGYDRDTTPALERFAAEGATFLWAIAPSSWTLPTHASLFTGLLPSETAVDWETPLDRAYPTLAERLTARGYASAGFVANLYYLTEDFGLNRGFQHWEDSPISANVTVQSEWFANRIASSLRQLAMPHAELVRKPGWDVTREFLVWLDELDGTRPFFAFLNYIDAHDPYGPAQPFTGLYSEPGDRFWHENKRAYSDDDLENLRNSYDSAIRYLDTELERLFAELAARKVLDRTLVVITSDHGEQFGEHDPRVVGHGGSLYMQALRVPLVLRYPGKVPSGTRVAAPVSLVDIPATIDDLVLHGGSESFPGRSLSALWRNGRASVALSELTVNHAKGRIPMASVVVDSFHYVKTGHRDEALFDLARDPEEQHDLAKSGRAPDTLERLRAVMSSRTEG